MQPIHKCTYILRLWRVDQSKVSDWRASLEIPETGKRIGFASLEQLFAYSIELVESKADAPQTGGGGPLVYEAENVIPRPRVSRGDTHYTDPCETCPRQAVERPISPGQRTG